MRYSFDVMRLVVSASFVVSQPEAAQMKDECNSLKPGNGAISGAFLTPYVREAQQITTEPGGRVINARPRWHDELSIIDVDGRKLMRRIWKVVAFTGAVHAVDTVLFDPASLAPVYNSEWVQGTVAWQRRYDGERVSGQKLAATAGGLGIGAQPGDPLVRLDMSLPGAVFDLFGGMDGLIAAAIDWKPGACVAIPIFDPSKNSLRSLELRVTGQEMVEAGRGKLVNAWIVTFDGLNGPMRLWVNRQAPFTYKSEEILLRDGKPWRIITSLMVVG